MTVVSIHSTLLFLSIFFPHRLRYSFRRRTSFKAVFEESVDAFEKKTIKNPQYQVQDPNDIRGNNKQVT